MPHQSVSLEQLDPDVARRCGERLAALPQLRWRLNRPVLLWGAAGGLLCGLAAGLITAQSPDSLLGMIVGFLCFAVFLAVGIRANHAARKRVKGSLSTADLRAVSRTGGLSRTETAYLEAIASLAESSPLLGESLTRDLLAQLNELAANARALETQRERLAAALGPTPLADLERERATLVGRLETAPDAASRTAIEQSIALCDGRLAHVRTMAPAVARVEAQEEVVYQTLASVEAALRRMSAAPAEPPPLQVEELRRTTTETVAQTRAVEEAIQEVLATASG